MLEKLHAPVPEAFLARVNKTSKLTHDPPRFKKSDFMYTKCYCEENVYLMTAKFLRAFPQYRTYACFISNDRKQVPVWHQGDELVTVWDYHVVFILVTPSGAYVYDLDSSLPFPSRFEDYVHLALRPDMPLLPIYARMFRVISGDKFVREFASDRSHMKDSDAVPPCYPPLRSSCMPHAETHNLPAHVDMTRNEGPGRVVDIYGLLHLFRR